MEQLLIRDPVYIGDYIPQCDIQQLLIRDPVYIGDYIP